MTDYVVDRPCEGGFINEAHSQEGIAQLGNSRKSQPALELILGYGKQRPCDDAQHSQDCDNPVHGKLLN